MIGRIAERHIEGPDGEAQAATRQEGDPQGRSECAEEVERQDANVVLRERDSGRGIDPSELQHPSGLQHLFEPIVQVHRSVARVRGGLGLGLAMVKGLIELHGGTVASDGVGCGTELSITLPLVPAPAASELVPEPIAKRRRRILVIEDNVDTAESLKEVLELNGHEVQVAMAVPTGSSSRAAFDRRS